MVKENWHPVSNYSGQRVGGERRVWLPDEGESSVGLSICLECLYYFSHWHVLLELDTEHGGEYCHSTQQADNVVEERSDCSQLHCPLCLLHECGICKKETNPSTCAVRERSSEEKVKVSLTGVPGILRGSINPQS